MFSLLFFSHHCLISLTLVTFDIFLMDGLIVIGKVGIFMSFHYLPFRNDPSVCQNSIGRNKNTAYAIW